MVAARSQHPCYAAATSSSMVLPLSMQMGCCSEENDDEEIRLPRLRCHPRWNSSNYSYPMVGGFWHSVDGPEETTVSMAQGSAAAAVVVAAASAAVRSTVTKRMMM